MSSLYHLMVSGWHPQVSQGHGDGATGAQTGGAHQLYESSKEPSLESPLIPPKGGRVEKSELEVQLEASIAHVQMKKRFEREWPADFALDEGMRHYARDHKIDPEREFEAWRDDCAAHARRYVDWAAAWRTRIRNAVAWARPQQRSLWGPQQRRQPPQPPRILTIEEVRRRDAAR